MHAERLYPSSQVYTGFPAFLFRLVQSGFTIAAYAVLTVSVHAVERLPIEDFAREPEMSRAKLSPGGNYVAFRSSHQNKMTVHVYDLVDAKHRVFNSASASFANDALQEVEDFTWVSDRRLLFSTTVWGIHYGVFAAELGGKYRRGLSGHESPGSDREHPPTTFLRDVLAARFQPEPVVLMINRYEDAYGRTQHPDVVKLDTETGAMSVVAKNPGNVVAWAADNRGIVRAGFTAEGNLSGMIYRETEKVPWRMVLPLENRFSGWRSLGYDSVADKFLVTSLDQNGRWAVYHVDPAKNQLGEPLLSDPNYDIVPAGPLLQVDGIPLSGPIFDADQKLIGFRYFTDTARVAWFDQEFAGYQRRIDRTLPKTTNVLVDVSRNGKRLLWFSYSDQDPGSYFLFNLESKTRTILDSRMSWINPEQMASMRPISYPARDGAIIHGYLTVPVGREAKNLPLIVLPHSAPWVRDVQEFDPLVQLLANRGFAILQMKYRRLSDEGEKAQRDIGKKIQNDIEDATRWAIASGAADPKRIAIVGAGYGGYSALFSLGTTPDLYRCGISIAGVTDRLSTFTPRQESRDKQGKEAVREQSAARKKDAERGREASLGNFAAKITSPVLFIHGKEDRVVPLQQAERMIAALEKNGRKPESLFLSKVGHSYGDEKARTLLFKRIVAFLETHLGPGVE